MIRPRQKVQEARAESWSTRGESLVETVVAFVIVAIALLAFSTFAISGSHLTGATMQSDSGTGDELVDKGTGSVKIGTEDTDPVKITGNDGAIYAYTMS